jgi:hypothetical protein
MDSVSNRNECNETSWGKGWQARNDDSLTAICEPIVHKTWNPRRLITLGPYTALSRASFTFCVVCNIYNMKDIQGMILTGLRE